MEIVAKEGWAQSDSETQPSLTLQFAHALRTQIRLGQRRPGERLQLQELCKTFGVSLSPVREGLVRLSTEGYVVPVGQRGYRIAPVSLAEYVGLVDLRTVLEVKGLQASITLGREEWETSLITTFERLRRFEAQRWTVEEIGGWEERHDAFHHALVSACGSPVLQRFCTQLHEMADRYRRVFLYASGAEPDRDVLGEHEVIYRAAIDRDATRASEALREHIQRTSDTVLKAMRSGLPGMGDDGN